MKNIILILVLFYSGQNIAHPLKMSIGEISFNGKEMQIEMRIFMDDLDLALTQFSKRRVCFSDYQKKQFDKAVLNPFKLYLQSNLEVSVNGKVLGMNMKSVTWVPGSLDGDNPALLVHLVLPSPKVQQIKKLKIKNTILVEYVTEQINMLSVVFSEKQKNALRFDSDVQYKELDLTKGNN